MIFVADTTVKLAAFEVLNFTALAPVNPEPVMVTVVPPAVGPVDGDSEVTAGATVYVYFLLAVFVPYGVSTYTYTDPDECAAAIAVIWLSLFTVKLVAATVPKITLVAPENLAPMIVTVTPPPSGPEFGVMLAMAGAAM